MYIPYVGIDQVQQIFVPNNGTMNFERPILDLTIGPEELLWISVENINLDDVAILTSPRRVDDASKVRPEVIVSIERSLDENSDVWAELSKY